MRRVYVESKEKNNDHYKIVIKICEIYIKRPGLSKRIMQIKKIER